MSLEKLPANDLHINTLDINDENKKYIYKPITKNLTPESINVIDTAEEWERLYELFTKDYTQPLVIGFDCEWTREHAISLVQMCNEQGMCLLLRVVNVTNQSGKLPDSFLELLKNKKILKMGVGIDEDSKRLTGRYGVVVRGCVDLRLLVMRVNVPNVRPLGLKYLSRELLGVELEKESGVRCGDWDALELSPKQKHYAAMDSLVSLEIFKELMRIQMVKSTSRLSSVELKKDKEDLNGGSNSIKDTFKVNHCNNRKITNIKSSCVDGSSVDGAFYDDDDDEEDDDEYNVDNDTYNVDDGYVYGIVAKTKYNLGNDKKDLQKDVNDRIGSKLNNTLTNDSIMDQTLEYFSNCIAELKSSSFNVTSLSNGGINGGVDGGSRGSSGSLNDGVGGGGNGSFNGVTDSLDNNLIMSLCQGVIDVKFKAKNLNKKIGKSDFKKINHFSEINTTPTTSFNPSSNKTTNNTTRVGLQGRKTPLYDNCMLLDTHGNPLTTCDSRKATWYLEKGLAEKVSDFPLRVRLLFEPAGRPMVGNNYYLQEKHNLCVVCGALDSYHRKNIIPREYRKHFPPLFKDHKSHDVILLCPSCHQHSTHQDTLQKQVESSANLSSFFSALALSHNAPIRSDKYQQSQLLTKAKSAAKALSNKHKIPEERRLELIGVLKEFYEEEKGEVVVDDEGVVGDGGVVVDGEMVVGDEGVVVDGEMDDEKEHKLIQFVNNFEDRKLNPAFEEHGRIVVEAISSDKQGLIEFERMWRQHFVDTMQPRYLPTLWSVDHCHRELELLQ